MTAPQLTFCYSLDRSPFFWNVSWPSVDRSYTVLRKGHQMTNLEYTTYLHSSKGHISEWSSLVSPSGTHQRKHRAVPRAHNAVRQRIGPMEKHFPLSPGCWVLTLTRLTVRGHRARDIPPTGTPQRPLRGNRQNLGVYPITPTCVCS